MERKWKQYFVFIHRINEIVDFNRYENQILQPFYNFLGLPYAEKTADYYADDYNYSSDDYPNGDADDNVENHLGEHETPIHVNPKMMSKDSDELINEGDIIKLPCVVDTLGILIILLKALKLSTP